MTNNLNFRLTTPKHSSISASTNDDALNADLTRSVNAVRGEPETLHRHSWHDLPELIDEVKVDLLEALLDSQKANDTITRLQGEARVMLDLLSEALGIIDTIELESATESEYMDAIKTEIKAVLVAKAGRPA